MILHDQLIIAVSKINLSLGLISTIRGLKTPQKVKILRKKIKRTDPTIVFLQETKFSMNKLQEINKKIWKGSEGMGIDARGYAGGLGILWDPNGVHLSSFNGNKCFISIEFKVIGFSLSGVITNFFGPHNSREKLNFFKTLKNIHERT